MTATASRPRAAGAAPKAPATIPGPEGHPLLGMAPALRRDLLGALQDGFERHGDVVALRVGPARGPSRLRRTVVAVRHPEEARRVLVETDLFVRRTPSYDVLRELFGETLVTMEHARWRKQKRILQPLFTRRHVAQYAGLVEAEAHAAVQRSRYAGDAPVDVARAMEQYALRVLGQTIFAEEDGIDAETIAALERLVPLVSSQVSDRAARLLRPPLRWPTPRNRRFLALRAELNATIERVIARRERSEADGEEDGDLLSRMRTARDPEDGTALTPKEVRDEALMFLIAGHTTTSNALTSTLHFLGCHPEVQERVAATAALDAADVADHEDLVRAAVQEAMRLHPPAYVLGRRTAAEVELGGYALPAGTLVLVCPWAMHRDPRFWPDPGRYDPARFIGEQARPRFSYLPFSAGGRACIGRHLALLESTILVRALLRGYRLESADRTMRLSPQISMRPGGPVHVRFHPRRPAGGDAA